VYLTSSSDNRVRSSRRTPRRQAALH
jgi:hypothetical protein